MGLLTLCPQIFTANETEKSVTLAAWYGIAVPRVFDSEYSSLVSSATFVIGAPDRYSLSEYFK